MFTWILITTVVAIFIASSVYVWREFQTAPTLCDPDAGEYESGQSTPHSRNRSNSSRQANGQINSEKQSTASGGCHLPPASQPRQHFFHGTHS
jgi:hypothetical protein